ncbi:MAG: hypothetical protein Q8930_17775 [Bacillota bacterium]|nr:hypothetical protein [Bacillota bacterium]
MSCLQDEKNMKVIICRLTLNPKKNSDGRGLELGFDLDESARVKLLNGYDDISLTLLNEDKITEFERKNGIA